MAKQLYPLLISALLAGFLGFSAWSAYRAATLGSDITDRDYYSKGLKYNSTLVEKRAATVLGWHLQTTLEGRQLQIQLLDKDGSLVAGAKGLLSFFQQTGRSAPILPLNEAQPGIYLVELPESLRGEVNIRINFERQGARLYRQLLLNI